MSPEVKCAVSNCTYWETGEKCSANNIQITFGGRSSDSFYTELSEELTKKKPKAQAVVAENTLCNTFKAKSS
jgi:hypothetical protein